MGPRRRGDDQDPTSHIGILDDAESPRDKRRRGPARDDEGLDLDSIW